MPADFVQTQQAVCISEIALYFDHPSPIDKHICNLFAQISLEDKAILLNHHGTLFDFFIDERISGKFKYGVINCKNTNSCYG
jgi:hypothetical protein